MSKGDETRERILDWAFRTASRDGLEGLSIGGLAAELGLSKSGLFAHFGSKEDLQIAVLQSAAKRYQDVVVAPALRAPRGTVRLRKWFENWIRWLNDPSVPGGCIFLAAVTELDDREGRPRDFLVASQRELLTAMAKAARLAVEGGQFRKDLDCDQLAFEIYGIVAACSHSKRLLRDHDADKRARTAFERLLTYAESS